MSGDFKIEDFKIIEKLGSGGFGEVYKAEYLKNDPIISSETNTNEVALKMIKSSVTLKKVLNEWETQKRLQNHPNIVKLYCYFKDTRSGAFCIVMELCKYGDLRKYVKEKGPLTPYRAAKILKQLVCALMHIHKNNVMHRDISPGNVLIYRAPDEKDPSDAPSIKLTDFGLARELEKNTPAKTYVGTPGYMAGEILAGDGYDVKGDNFSVGSLLFFMLTGKEPTPNESTLDFSPYRGVPSSAIKLIKELRAPVRDRLALNDVMRTDFVEEYIGVSMSGASVERSRRGTSRPASYRREASHSADRQYHRSGPVESGQLQRKPRAEGQSTDYIYSREPSRSRGLDSGFLSNRASSQPQRQCSKHNDSVANGFVEKWPVDPLRLLPADASSKVELTPGFRAVINERGHFIVENFKSNGDDKIVDNIIRITFTPDQTIEFLRPKYRNMKAPQSKGDPPIAVDEAFRRVYFSRAELEKDESDFQQYRITCRKLWAMGHDVPRVTAKHPLFSWGLCRLMENGDLRIAGNKEHPTHDKLTRKMQNGNIVYKRITSTGQSHTLTDAGTMREMNEVYEMLIDYENIALKYGIPFPLNISSGNIGKSTATSYQMSRGTLSTLSLPKASVASAPATMYTVPSRSRPLLPVENIGRQAPSRKYGFKENKDPKYITVIDKSTGYTLRTSTINPELAIFRRNKNEEEREERFLYKNIQEIPRDALGLANELLEITRKKT